MRYKCLEDHGERKICLNLSAVCPLSNDVYMDKIGEKRYFGDKIHDTVVQ